MPEPSGCLGLLAKLLGLGGGRGKGPPPLPLPYAVTERFLSPAELSFYQVLRSLLSAEVVICPKVRLADVLFTRRPHENRAAMNRLQQKHLDFLICDAATMTPRLVIELDDASHQRADRQERDAFVDAAMRAAGLPIIHIRAARSYVPAELQSLIQAGVGNGI